MFGFGKKKKQEASVPYGGIGENNERMKPFTLRSEEEYEIYIHVPFCVRKCRYCDFLSMACDESVREQYVEDLHKEIREYAEFLKAEEKLYDRPVRSIFVGGGTPTVLSAESLTRILGQVFESFHVKEDAEITIECNPGTASFEKLAALRKAGFNRISIGMQAADDAMLAKLGRIHTHADTVECVQAARKAGFENLSLDLMSALPGQSLEDYMAGVQAALDLKPDHISAYSLIIEPGTEFHKLYGENGPLVSELPDEDTDREMYARTRDLLRENGFERYEISNYAKPGRECIHNMGYWTGYDYLGFGLGASSLWDRTRYQNVTRLEEYHNQVAAADFGKLHTAVQKLTRKECMEEHMFLGLRMIRGISKSEFESKFQVRYETVLGPQTARLLKQGLIRAEGDTICLTDFGLDVSNRVFAEFLLDEE